MTSESGGRQRTAIEQYDTLVADVAGNLAEIQQLKEPGHHAACPCKSCRMFRIIEILLLQSRQLAENGRLFLRAISDGCELLAPHDGDGAGEFDPWLADARTILSGLREVTANDAALTRFAGQPFVSAPGSCPVRELDTHRANVAATRVPPVAQGGPTGGA